MNTKKALSQGEINAYAFDVLAELKGVSAQSVVSNRLLAETPSVRRAILESVCQLAKANSYADLKIDPERLGDFLEKASEVAQGQKSGNAEKYVRSLFSWAVILGGDNRDALCKRAFVAMFCSEQNPQTVGKSKVPGLEITSALVESVGLLRGLTEALCDDSLENRMVHSFPDWSGIVTELVASGSTDLGLSAVAVQRLIDLMGRQEKLDRDSLMSLSILMARGIVPSEEFKSSRFFRKISKISGPRIPCSTVVSDGVQPASTKASVEFANPETRELADSLGKLLIQMDAGFALRVKALSGELKLAQERLHGLNAELEANKQKASSLEFRVGQLHERLERQRLELEEKEKVVVAVKAELRSYTDSHDVLVVTSGQIEHDVSERVKREFSEQCGAVLVDVRNYIAQVYLFPNQDLARLAVSSFNRLARTLRNQGFMQQGTLERIETANQAEGGQ